MPEIQLKTLPNDTARRLRWPLRLTMAGMVGQALLHAFWPFLTLWMTCAAFFGSGLIAALPAGWGIGMLAVFGLAILATLAHGAWNLRLPSGLDARARLDETLPGQPIAALTDSQAVGADDASSRAVWQAHRARMIARLNTARAAKPDLRLAVRDPYALRYISLLALTMVLGFGPAFRTTDLSALLPAQTGARGAVATSWEGWITPPAYTGLPSLYLNDQHFGPLEVPMGSQVIVRFYGKVGDLALSQEISVQATSQATPQIENQTDFAFDVTQSGALKIQGPNPATWQIVALGDTPPMIRPTGDMTHTLGGDLQQGFAASDDYGITSGQARITLDIAAISRNFGLAIAPEPRADLVFQIPMPFRGNRREVIDTIAENVAEHPWVDLPVLLELSAMDAVGQVGFGMPLAVTLPGRRFLDPLAMALIEQRRALLWNRENARQTAQILRAISNRPDDFFDRDATYLTLRVLVRRLEAGARSGLNDALRDEITKALWDIATGIEDANLSDARDALRRAQERLSEAMKQGASDEELAELMDDLRQAMRDYTQQLAQQGGENGGDEMGEGSDGQEVTPDDLDAMLEAIEQAMNEGREAQAQAMLEALAELMENMQVAEGEQNQGGDSPGEQAMQGLGESLDQQQGLSDEAFRELQQQRGQDGEGGPDGELSDRQSQLADEIARQRGALPGAGSEGGDAARRALEDAERAMRQAAEGLAEGDVSGALDKQAEAVEALREGMRQLDNAMAEAERDSEGQQGETDGRRGDARPNDPLGRGGQGRGGVDEDAPLQAGPDVYRRAEELMRDIRRRAGDRARPEVERDYLQRLLDRF